MPGENPFIGDPDRAEIWDMLVRRDIAAFVAADWDMVADDFVAENFVGLHGHNSSDPDAWTAAFPTLDHYRVEWLRQAAETAATEFAEPLEAAIHRATSLNEIEISGDFALVRKKFDGSISKATAASTC